MLKLGRKHTLSYVEGACDICRTLSRLTKRGNQWLCPRHSRIEDWKQEAKAKLDREEDYTDFWNEVKSVDTGKDYNSEEE